MTIIHRHTIINRLIVVSLKNILDFENGSFGLHVESQPFVKIFFWDSTDKPSLVSSNCRRSYNNGLNNIYFFCDGVSSRRRKNLVVYLTVWNASTYLMGVFLSNLCLLPVFPLLLYGIFGCGHWNHHQQNPQMKYYS